MLLRFKKTSGRVCTVGEGEDETVGGADGSGGGADGERALVVPRDGRERAEERRVDRQARELLRQLFRVRCTRPALLRQVFSTEGLQQKMRRRKQEPFEKILQEKASSLSKMYAR